MSEESCISVEIVKKVPFFGEGDSLESRLRRVILRGFPDVKIYKNSNFELVNLTSDEIETKLHTPQPSVYRPILDRVDTLAKLFADQGVNIFDLDAAYDYIATSSSGEKTEWTLLPPVVERWNIPKHSQGGFDYSSLMGQELLSYLKNNDLDINKSIIEHPYTGMGGSGVFDLINDGSHRVHAGFENGGVRVLRIDNMTFGYPYYAIPQSYSTVQVFARRDETTAEKKVHILQSPAHKQLYRLFPTGGIMSGDLRPDANKK